MYVYVVRPHVAVPHTTSRELKLASLVTGPVLDTAIYVQYTTQLEVRIMLVNGALTCVHATT